MIEVSQALVLGLVQGITAWIPVSSKTQVILSGKLLYDMDFMSAVSFALLVHTGDFLATLWLFRKEISAFFIARPDISDLRNMEKLPQEKSLLWFVVISVFFSGAIGLPLYLSTRDGFSDLPGTLFLAIVGATLILLGLVMWATSRRSGNAGMQGAEKPISLRDTILAGCAQGLAVIPGISRSGITESTLLLRGYHPHEAVRLSFFMSIPMIFVSISAFFWIEGFSNISVPSALTGITAAFFASILMMRTMLYLAEKVKFYYFNIAIGLLAMVPFAFQLLTMPA